MLAAIPLMIFPLIAYNVLVFSPYGDLGPAVLENPVLSVSMMSGAVWTMQVSDIVIVGRFAAAFRRGSQGNTHWVVVGYRSLAIDPGVRRFSGRIPSGRSRRDRPFLHSYRYRLRRPDRRLFRVDPLSRA